MSKATEQAKLCAMLAQRIAANVEHCKKCEVTYNYLPGTYSEPPERGHGWTKSEIQNDIVFLRRELMELSRLVGGLY